MFRASEVVISGVCPRIYVLSIPFGSEDKFPLRSCPAHADYEVLSYIAAL
jgi:hypothetical protein